MDLNKIREKYKPNNVKVLFICESPPKQTFFYQENSILYYATKIAFINVFGEKIYNNFLENFKEMGFFLIDMFEERGINIEEVDRENKLIAMRLLENKLSNLKPEVIIITPKRIEKEVSQVIKKVIENKDKTCCKEIYTIPFPTYNFGKYIEELEGILKKISKNLIVDKKTWMGKRKIIAKLIDNVQFIYELALAKLELESLGVKFRVTNSLREFELLEVKDENRLIKRLAYFGSVDNRVTDYFKIIKQNVTKSVNQYLTHWIYPYKGKFHPQMIRALLNIIKLDEGDTVLDPFIGSGTTAVEAQLLGINCIGIDISPLCVLQSKVKTESLFVVDEIKSLANDAKKSFTATYIRTLELTNDTDIIDYNSFLESIDDERVKNFYLIAKLIAISDETRRRRNKIDSFVKNLDLMIKSIELHRKIVDELGLSLGKVEIKRADSRNLPLSDESVDGIITSPPYSIALDYVKNDAHALQELGYDLREIRNKFVGVRGSGELRVKLYNEDMKRSLKEMYRVLKPGKYCVIVIGNARYQGKEIKTVEFFLDYCQKIGFKLIKNIDKIIYGLYNVMQKENILIFQKM